MAVIRPRSSYATSSGSTTSAAPRAAYLSPAWPRRRPHSDIRLVTVNPFDWEARSHPAVRQRTEQREELLSKFASRSRDSADRDHPELPDPMRTAYQIDRD